MPLIRPPGFLPEGFFVAPAAVEYPERIILRCAKNCRRKTRRFQRGPTAERVPFAETGLGKMDKSVNKQRINANFCS